MEKSKELSNYIKYSNNDNEIKINRKEGLNIILYLISKTTSLLGTNIYSFALSLYILNSTGSGASFAINVLIGMLPRIILGPFAGVLADRVDRKKLTIIFDIISGLAVFTLLGFSTIYGLKIIAIYMTNFVLSTINVFYDTALNSSLPNLVRDEKLMKINSYGSLSTSVSGVLAPLLAGIIYGFLSIKSILIINAISFILSSILESFIDFNINNNGDSSEKPAMSFRNIRIEIKEILSFIKEKEELYSLMKYSLVLNLFFVASMTVVYPYIINKVLKMSSTSFGTFQGSHFVGMIIASIIIGNIKEKEDKINNLPFKISAIGIIILLIGLQTLDITFFRINSILFIYNVVLTFSLGVVLIVVNTPIMVKIQRLTPENLRGRITGVIGTLCGGIAPIGIIVTGLLIDKVHPFMILSVAGISIILVGIHSLKAKI